MELCIDTNQAALPVIRFEGVYAEEDKDWLEPLPESFQPVSKSLIAWIEAGCPRR